MLSVYISIELINRYLKLVNNSLVIPAKIYELIYYYKQNNFLE